MICKAAYGRQLKTGIENNFVVIDPRFKKFLAFFLMPFFRYISVYIFIQWFLFNTVFQLRLILCAPLSIRFGVRVILKTFSTLEIRVLLFNRKFVSIWMRLCFADFRPAFLKHQQMTKFFLNLSMRN